MSPRAAALSAGTTSVRAGYRQVKPLDFAQDQIQEALHDCTLSLDAAD